MDQNEKTKPASKLRRLVPPQRSKLKTMKISQLDLDDRSVVNSYEVKDEVGSGGMGIIHQVFDKKIHRNLAMKVLKVKDNPKMEKLFIEEALLTGQLEHPNIIPIHDLGSLEDGKSFFTMKLLAGENMRTILTKLAEEEGDVEQCDIHDMLIIFRKVCDAVAFAHSRGVIHRDIKPENIMVGEYGEVLLMDWGLAKFVGENKNVKDKKYIAGTIYSNLGEEEDNVQGTPLYIAPEQACGMVKLIDTRTDIYLLGATLYHMLTFFPPHMGQTVKDMLLCSVEGKFAHPQERNPEREIPHELSRIILKAMALKQENRYQKVEELAVDVDNFISGHIVSMPIPFRKGEFLIEEGDQGSDAYIILKGTVEIFKNIRGKNVMLATMGKGEIVGEMSLVTAGQRTAHVVACEDVEVQRIDNNLFKQILSRVPAWIEKMILNLVHRLDTLSKKVHVLTVNDPIYHILNQLGMLCYIMATNEGKPIEQYPLKISQMSKEVAVNLSIAQERVTETLTKLSRTAICQKIDEDQFTIGNRYVFWHLLDFLCKVLEVEKVVNWYSTPPPLDPESKNMMFQAAGSLSTQVEEFLMSIYSVQK